MGRIILYRQGTIWLATVEDPKVEELFGTRVLPTPYSSQVAGQEVLEEIARLNPGEEVILLEMDR